MPDLTHTGGDTNGRVSFGHPAAPTPFSSFLSLLALPSAALAALLQVARMPREARPLALMLPLACFIAPIFNPPRVMALGLITPLLLLGLMLVLQRQAVQSSA